MKKISLAVLLFLVVLSGLKLTVFGQGASINIDKNDMVSGFEDIYIDEPFSGSVVSFFGDVYIKEQVTGDLVVLFGDAKVHADITGEIVVVFGKTEIADGVEIGGSVLSIGRMQKGSARIGGEIVRIYPGDWDADIEAVVFVKTITVVVFSVFIFLVGLAICALLKEKLADIQAAFENSFGIKILFGFIIYIALIIMLLPLFVTILYPLAFIILLAIAEGLSAIFFGRIISAVLKAKYGIYIQFTTGLITITLIKVLLLSMIPYGSTVFNISLYLLFELFVICLGIGFIISMKKVLGK